VEEVFGQQTCLSEDPTIGRNRYYERYLIAQNQDSRTSDSDRLTPGGIKKALGRLRSVEYRKVRLFVENEGRAKATNVSVRMADGFFLMPREPQGSFVLRPKDLAERDFRTETGISDPHTENQFSVDWERAEGLDDSSPIGQLAILFILVFGLPIVLVAMRDLKRFRQGAKPE
jgi:hypothetical protein